jgi:DNA-binding phage protein
MTNLDDRRSRLLARVVALRQAVAELPPDREEALLDSLGLAMIDADLRAAITASGLTPYALSVKASVAPEVIYRFMSGERDLRLRTAAKIANALGLELKK